MAVIATELVVPVAFGIVLINQVTHTSLEITLWRYFKTSE